jgi:hypothetical protein
MVTMVCKPNRTFTDALAALLALSHAFLCSLDGDGREDLFVLASRCFGVNVYNDALEEETAVRYKEVAAV